MIGEINRREGRKRASVHAFVTDLADLFQIKCSICDVSRSGCRIVTSRAHDLPRAVQIIPEGFHAPLRGIVVWRRHNEAGVCLEHGFNDQHRAELAIILQVLEADCDEGDGSPARKPLSYAERLEKYRAAAR